MSDLLPLVAAVLNDRTALDAQNEIKELQEKLALAYSVEVIRKSRNEDGGQPNGPGEENDDGDQDEEEVVVYSSAPFQCGRYGLNPLYWEVNMQQSASRICRLEDLEDCMVCVGGGFPLVDFSRHGSFEGWLDESEDDGDDCKSMNINFASAPIWIDLLVQGWPREAWEAKIQADDLEPEECIHYLVDEVAEQYPEATIQVTSISFNSREVHPAMKRLLPPRAREEAQAELDGRVSRSDEEEALIHFACATLRNTNPSAGSALYGIYVRDTLNALGRIGIKERSGENDELVTALIDVRVSGGVSGRDNFDQLVNRLVEARAGYEDEASRLEDN